MQRRDADGMRMDTWGWTGYQGRVASYFRGDEHSLDKSDSSAQSTGVYSSLQVGMIQ